MSLLGKKAKDKITGFEGTITGQCIYLTGCTQYSLAPHVNDSGDFAESRWFDEGCIKILKDEGLNKKDLVIDKPGGPAQNPPKGR